jgi:hypothetical protein
MKFIVFIFFFLGACFNTQAALLNCRADDAFADNSGKNYQFLNKEEVYGTCDVLNPGTLKVEDKLKFSITSKVGYGFRGSADEGIFFTCPTVYRENLTNRKFIGLKASASVILGVDVAVFSNSRVGICILTGIQIASIGGGISGASLVFSKDFTDSEQ